MDTTTALAARHAPLEYLVRPGGGEVRLSVWVDGRGRVIHEPGGPSGDARVGESVIAASSSRGTAGGVEWDLHYEVGPV